MDRLPAELVIKILRKTDPQSIYRWKYQNKRVSYIISKYLRYYEVEVLRFSLYMRTATLHNGEEFQLYPTSLFPKYLQKIAKKIEAQTAVIDRVLMHNIKITGTLNSNNFSQVLPKIELIKHLEITNVTFKTDDLLRWFLKVYRVESLVLDCVKFGNFSGQFWKKMLENNNKMQHLCLSRLHLEFDACFLMFIQFYEVSYVSITANNMKFSFEYLLTCIQSVLDRSVPINWSFFVKESHILYSGYKLNTLQEFVNKNSEHIVRITEERCKTGRQMLQIKFRCGQVQFPIRGSYLGWRDPKRWDLRKLDNLMNDKQKEYLVYVIFVLLLLGLFANIML